MSTNQQHSTKPFPVENFAKMQITDDNFIIDSNNRVIGYMQPNKLFPTDIKDMEIESDEIESLIKRGCIYPGYENWFINKFGLPVEPFDLDGYPKGTVTRDMWNYYYFKDICIGVKVRDGIADVEGEETERLEEYGIEHSHLYGIEPKLKIYINSDDIIIAYKVHPTSSKIKVNDSIVVEYEDQKSMIGQMKNGLLYKLSDELIAKYTKLGFKMASDELIKASTV